jgi:hypothetical protein
MQGFDNQAARIQAMILKNGRLTTWNKPAPVGSVPYYDDSNTPVQYPVYVLKTIGGRGDLVTDGFDNTGNSRSARIKFFLSPTTFKPETGDYFDWSGKTYTVDTVDEVAPGDVVLYYECEAQV